MRKARGASVTMVLPGAGPSHYGSGVLELSTGCEGGVLMSRSRKCGGIPSETVVRTPPEGPILKKLHNEMRNKSSLINNMDRFSIVTALPRLCAMIIGKSIVCAIGTPYAKTYPVIYAVVIIVASRLRPKTYAIGDIIGISEIYALIVEIHAGVETPAALIRKVYDICNGYVK